MSDYGPTIESLDDWNEMISKGGCCPMPDCCPPLLECQSGFVRAFITGFSDSSSGSDSDAASLYSRRVRETTGDGYTETSTYPHDEPSPGATWNQVICTDDGYDRFIEEYAAPMDISLSGAYFSGACHIENAELTETCEYGGSQVVENHAIHWNGSAWQDYKASEYTYAYSSGEGDSYPGDPGGIYGPCTLKIVTTFRRWDPVFDGGNLIGTTLAEETSSTSYSVIGTINGPATIHDATYENLVTPAAFLAAAEAWVAANDWRIFDDNSDNSDSSSCEPGALCNARRDFTDGMFEEDFSRYRWKLDKCCGLYAALSWLEVFYSMEFIDWLSGGFSGDAPDTPTATPKAWEWSGTILHPECDDSGSGSDSTELDPYDAEERWSPWSLALRVPAGEKGEVHLRRLFVTCHRSDAGSKPQYFNILENYDASDLNQDGINDSSQ